MSQHKTRPQLQFPILDVNMGTFVNSHQALALGFGKRGMSPFQEDNLLPQETLDRYGVRESNGSGCGAPASLAFANNFNFAV